MLFCAQQKMNLVGVHTFDKYWYRSLLGAVEDGCGETKRGLGAPLCVLLYDGPVASEGKRPRIRRVIGFVINLDVGPVTASYGGEV